MMNTSELPKAIGSTALNFIRAVYRYLLKLLIKPKRESMYTYTFTPTSGTPVTFTTDTLLPTVAGVIEMYTGGGNGGGGPGSPD